MSPATKRRSKIAAAFAAACLAGGLVFVFFVGQKLVAPVPRTLGPPPADLHAQSVHFSSESGSTIAGWLTERPDARGSVLLLHAVRADRRSMTDRARFLNAAGYNTLCIDFQAHGESPGRHITMGALEALDAAAGLAWLRNRFPDLPTAVIGTSLGAASALMAKYDDPPDAIVAEAVFGDVNTAIDNRLEMRFGPPGRLLTPLLSCQFRIFLGIDANDLSPLRAAADVREPVFVIHGAEDRRATPAEARAVFAALPGPKEIWEIPGAAHVDLHHYAKEDYEKKVGAFLARYLHSEPISKIKTQKSTIINPPQ